MIPTPSEPIVNHLGPVDGVCPQGYPIAYAHLLQSYCFELEPSTLFLYYNHQTTKRYCQFCSEKLDQDNQNNCEFFTSWHSICKLECIYMNCYGCQELLITPRKRAADCRECIEQYLNNKFKISQGNEVLVENIPA